MFKKITLLTILILSSITESSYSMQPFNRLKAVGAVLAVGAGAVWIFLKHKVGGYERVAKKLAQLAEENNYAAAKKLLDEGVPARPNDEFETLASDFYILDAAKSAIDHNNMPMLNLILDRYSNLLIQYVVGSRNLWPPILLGHAARKNDTNPAILQNVIDRLKRYPATIGTVFNHAISNYIYPRNINCPHFGPEEFIAFKALIDQDSANLNDPEYSTLHALVGQAMQYPVKNNPFLERIDYLLTKPVDLELERRGKKISDYLQFKGKNKDTIIRIRELILAKRKRIILDDTQAIACLSVPLRMIIIDYAYEDEFQVLLAIKNNELNRLKYLLENGYKADAKNDNGKTALMYAAQTGNRGAVEILLAHRADTLAVENHGMTALMFAAEQGDAEIVRMIVDATPAAERQNLINRQSTHSYVHRSRRGALPANRYIPAAVALDFGVDNSHNDLINDVSGTTALIFAAKNNHQAVVEVLLGFGADKTLADVRGKSALTYAGRNRNEAIVKMLQ